MTDQLKPGDRVRSILTGDVGRIEKLATLQIGPTVSDDNPLFIVYFEKLGEMRDLSVKLTADNLEKVHDDEEDLLDLNRTPEDRWMT